MVEPQPLGRAVAGVAARRVALFVPCYVDTLFPEAAQAVVHLLERLGVAVSFPREQTCCGQMHVNTGYQREAVPLVRNVVRAFAAAQTVVAPSASCVALVRDHYAHLAARAGDPALEREVAALVPRVVELTEYLIDHLGVEDVGASFPHAVAFHPTCHSVRMLHVGDRPLRLLRRVRGLRLLELPRADQCCGFGGTFAVKHAETSAAMLADKISDVISSRAEVLVAADNSCLMHIGGGLARQRTGVRTMHLAEVLASTEGSGA
jgi:L-lactate dehydrogenase complex protein LldE